VACLGERKRGGHDPCGLKGPDSVSKIICAFHRGSFSATREWASTHNPAFYGITGKLSALRPNRSVLILQRIVCFASGTAKLVSSYYNHGTAEDLFKWSLRDTVSEITSRGIRVIIVKQFPEQKFEVPRKVYA